MSILGPDEKARQPLTDQTRRRFVSTVAKLGIAVPVVAPIFALPGGAAAQGASPGPEPVAPKHRGGGGHLSLLWWQGPTLLNPHFATGQKDLDAARLFYEPLAAVDPEGNLVPILAAEIPSLENGGVARDGTSVTWKLKRDVIWHDGKPFTADDVVFTWEYIVDPATASTSIGLFKDVRLVEKVDSHTARIVFNAPVPAWSRALVGNGGSILPRHLFDAYRGAKSREAPWNLKPVGTGPYRFVDFKPGDLVRAEIHRDYHEAMASASRALANRSVLVAALSSRRWSSSSAIRLSPSQIRTCGFPAYGSSWK